MQRFAAVTQYSAAVRPEFTLREYSSKREVEFAIDDLEMQGGMTMTAPALNYIRRAGFSTENGGRENVPKVSNTNPFKAPYKAVLRAWT